jgi:hypothetical protein
MTSTLFTAAIRALCCLCLTFPIATMADPPAIVLPLPEDGAIERLKAGEYLWAPAIAPAGPVMVIVSLKRQRAYVYRNGVPIGVSTVSTGKPGHLTPTGVFTILQKAVEHRSNKYSNAPMPYMERLTWYGIAMHAGHLPGYPASHGCIRLPAAFAKLLFGITKLGLTVVITNDATAPEISPQPDLIREPVLADTTTGYLWEPERAPAGPVSIVLSGRDKRIVVLRNGRLIGSASIVLDKPILVTAAYVLQSVDDQGRHWARLPLPGGQTELGADRPSPRLPAGFRTALLGILVPGTTVLVTRDTLRSSETGVPLTVITTSH